MSPSGLDLIFRDAALPGREDLVDIGVRRRRIAAIEPRLAADAPVVALGGRLAVAGFVNSHIHLDKACLLGRCGHRHGGLADAIRTVSALKRELLSITPPYRTCVGSLCCHA